MNFLSSSSGENLLYSMAAYMHKETKHHNTDKSIYPKPKQMFNCVGLFDVINSVKYGKHKTKFSSYIKSTSFLRTLFVIWRSLKRESSSCCCVSARSVVISNFCKVCLLWEYCLEFGGIDCEGFWGLDLYNFTVNESITVVGDVLGILRGDVFYKYIYVL